MNQLISNIEKRVADLEAEIQDQPKSKEASDKLTELAARLISSSNELLPIQPDLSIERRNVAKGESYHIDCETNGSNGVGPATILIIKN